MTVRAGVSLPGWPGNPATLDAWIGRYGVPAYLNWYVAWRLAGKPGVVAPAALAACHDRNILPMVTWEPWGPDALAGDGWIDLAAVAEGRWDAYVLEVGRGLARHEGPVLVRFAHEMNGDWYPWSVGTRVTPAVFGAAWRRVRRLVREEAGASNVSLVWCPNVAYRGSADLNGCWPGDGQAEVLGVDGYRVADERPGQLFGPSLKAIRRIAGDPTLPLLVCETAAAPAADRARFVAGLGRLPVDGVLWFDMNKERDWRLAADAASEAAWRRLLNRGDAP